MPVPASPTLNEFLARAVVDIGAAFSAPFVLIGDRLGLYKALATIGPATPTALAEYTATAERYVREWLSNQAAGGYISYDATTGSFSLSEEQALCLANETSPVFLPGAFQIIAAIQRVAPKMIERFQTGAGLDWGEHDALLFEGTERFFRSSYGGNLVSSWIPALQGVEDKLRSGARVADVGCGLGASTIIMAKGYPRSTFVGFDYHGPSIEMARQRAKEAGVSDRVSFEVADAIAYPGYGYDFVAHFDAYHDLADPVAAAKHVLESLDKDGTWMIVEPYAGDHLADNLNPVGRLFYAGSTLICVPNSLAGNGAALGSQVGETKLGEIVAEAGFTRFRRATETPFNLILEAKP